jgi:replication factor A1
MLVFRRAILSDGKNSHPALFVKETLSLIEQEQLVPSSIVKVIAYVASHNNGKVLLMVSNVEVLERESEIQGTPVSLAPELNKDGKSTSSQPIKAVDAKVEPRKPDSSPEPTPSTTGTTSDHEMKDATASPTPKGPSIVSSPPTVKKAPESIPKSQGSTSIIPIQGLNPYQSKWTIKARVVTKQGIRSFAKKNGGGESRVLSVNLMDHTCDIKASFWNEAADRYEGTLVVGKCYTFSRGKTQMANRRFNDTKSEYELSFNGDCIVEMCEDSEAPSVAYNFCAIDRLDTMIGKVLARP